MGQIPLREPCLVAEKILTDSPYPALRKERYASFDSGQGEAFEKGSLSLEEISKIGIENRAPNRISGKQEMFENIINQYL